MPLTGRRSYSIANISAGYSYVFDDSRSTVGEDFFSWDTLGQKLLRVYPWNRRLMTSEKTSSAEIRANNLKIFTSVSYGPLGLIQSCYCYYSGRSNYRQGN